MGAYDELIEFAELIGKVGDRTIAVELSIRPGRPASGNQVIFLANLRDNSGLVFHHSLIWDDAKGQG
jgi:hypothetical protein